MPAADKLHADKIVVTVSFTVTDGETWTDPEGQEWKVVGLQQDHALLERVVSERVSLMEMVKHWEKND